MIYQPSSSCSCLWWSSWWCDLTGI